MKRMFSIPLGALAGGIAGLILGMLLMSLEHSWPWLLNFLGTPALWIFTAWHALGLPPRGEAAFAGPFYAFFVQWIILGLVIGAFLGGWRRRIARQR